MTRTRAAVVMISVERLSDRRRGGYWLAEVAYPWLALRDAGWDVVPISTIDGNPEPGGVDMSDREQRRFQATPEVRERLRRVRRAEFYLPQDFGVVVYAGGAGSLFDLHRDRSLAAFTGAVVVAGGVVAACGFGVAGLLDVTGPSGRPLLEERTVTAPSADEEDLLGLTGLLPFSLADELVRRRACPVYGPQFGPHVERDGVLITGQNPASAKDLAAMIITATTELSPRGGREAR